MLDEFEAKASKSKWKWTSIITTVVILFILCSWIYLYIYILIPYFSDFRPWPLKHNDGFLVSLYKQFLAYAGMSQNEKLGLDRLGSVINTFIAPIGIAGIIITLLFQGKQLKLQIKEIENNQNFVSEQLKALLREEKRKQEVEAITTVKNILKVMKSQILDDRLKIVLRYNLLGGKYDEFLTSDVCPQLLDLADDELPQCHLLFLKVFTEIEGWIDGLSKLLSISLFLSYNADYYMKIKNYCIQIDELINNEISPADKATFGQNNFSELVRRIDKIEVKLKRMHAKSNEDTLMEDEEKRLREMFGLNRSLLPWSS